MAGSSAMALPRGRPWGGDDYAMELHETAMETHGTFWPSHGTLWPFHGPFGAPHAISWNLVEPHGSS